MPHNVLQEVVEMINMCDLDWPWWAPECISNRIFDITTDVWAFGCVIFEVGVLCEGLLVESNN